MMKKLKSDNPHIVVKESNKNENNLPGYPIYPEDEDIFNMYLEDKDIDTTNILMDNESGEILEIGERTFQALNEEFPGADLDIPGADLDDAMEYIGSEDEENNYYSLGGDNHEDLEENQGE
jgi:hypothetical protein